MSDAQRANPPEQQAGQTSATPTSTSSAGAAPESSGTAGSVADESPPEQKIAQLENRIRELGPHAELSQALLSDPRGRELVEKFYNTGKFFDEAPAAKPAVPAPQNSQQPALTRDALHDELDRRDAARRHWDEINTMAKDELKHYDKVSKNPQFVNLLNGMNAALWNPNETGVLPTLPGDLAAWPDQNLARNYAAVRAAYHGYVSQNPKVAAAAKEAGKREAQERADAALAGSLPSAEGGTSLSTEETPEKTPEQQELERVKRAMTVGKPFSRFNRKI